MTPATEKSIRPRTITVARENQLVVQSLRDGSIHDSLSELRAERQISRLLADMLSAARLECDDPTRRKIDAVIEKYEGVS